MKKFIDLVSEKIIEYENTHPEEIKEKNKYHYTPGERSKISLGVRKRHALERKLGIFKHILR